MNHIFIIYMILPKIPIQMKLSLLPNFGGQLQILILIHLQMVFLYEIQMYKILSFSVEK